MAIAPCVPAIAQSHHTGRHRRNRLDASNAVIPNAAIVIRNAGTNAEVDLTTDAAGFFKARQLAPGTYTVIISAPGFSEQRSSDVLVQVNLVTELNQHLQAGEQSQVVDVIATTPVLNIESPVFGGHLSNTEIENIPINNRRWSALALTTPGVTPNSDGFGLLSSEP